MNKPSVGVIGVGAMGMGVVKRLLRHGYQPHVRDIRAERETEAAAAGARVAANPAALAAACDIVITLVVDDRQSDDILFGPDGAIHALRAGSFVVLSSTLAPEYVVAAAQRLAARGVSVLDAPVSGGPLRAENGSMSMMLAAPNAACEHCAALLAALSNNVFRVSERVGDGARMKLVNNMMAAANLVAGCEALALGIKLGLQPKIMLDVIGASSGASWIVPERIPRALANDFAPRAATTLLTKDVALFLQQARRANYDAPMANAAYAAFVRAIERGYGALDDAAVLRPYLEDGGTQDAPAAP